MSPRRPVAGSGAPILAAPAGRGARLDRRATPGHGGGRAEQPWVSGVTGSDAGEEEQRRRVVAAVYDADPAVRALGIAVVATTDGSARVETVVRADMVNSHRVSHGGLIFLLADTAMAYASIRPDGAIAMTTAADVVFSRPAPEGCRLAADSRRVHRDGRREVHDVRVTDENGTVIALVRGQMTHRAP
jgi:acyl-CoA thioesterase